MRHLAILEEQEKEQREREAALRRRQQEEAAKKTYKTVKIQTERVEEFLESESSEEYVAPPTPTEKLSEEERWGRLVCDYRKVCEITECEPGVQTNGDEMTMWMAAALWKSLCDLLWGYNHIILTRRVARLLQIATSLGLLKPTVLPFGIHGGPTGFQVCVNDAFKELIRAKKVKAFIDDVGTGTGDAADRSIVDPCDEKNAHAERAFQQHLETLAEMLARAIDTGLKFKLSKCHFAQLNIKCLGFILGHGVRSLDPDKIVAAIA